MNTQAAGLLVCKCTIVETDSCRLGSPQGPRSRRSCLRNFGRWSFGTATDTCRCRWGLNLGCIDLCRSCCIGETWLCRWFRPRHSSSTVAIESPVRRRARTAHFETSASDSSQSSKLKHPVKCRLECFVRHCAVDSLCRLDPSPAIDASNEKYRSGL